MVTIGGISLGEKGRVLKARTPSAGELLPGGNQVVKAFGLLFVMLRVRVRVRVRVKG